MPKKYKITGTNSGLYPVGTICYEFLGHDYGLSSDDSRLLGDTFVSVTLDPAGGYPSFTIRERNLEEIKTGATIVRVDPVATAAPAPAPDAIAMLGPERVKLYVELLPRVRGILERNGVNPVMIDDIAIGIAREISIDPEVTDWLLAELQRIHRPN